MRYMARRPLAVIDKLMRVDTRERILEMWTPNGWVPDNDASWTGIGGSADWDEISEEEAEAVIEKFQADARPTDTTLYTVSHDGDMLGTGLTAEEAYEYVLDHQSGSYYVATKYDGWEVEPEESSLSSGHL
jgi:hypothetical protein